MQMKGALRQARLNGTGRLSVNLSLKFKWNTKAGIKTNIKQIYFPLKNSLKSTTFAPQLQVL